VKLNKFSRRNLSAQGYEFSYHTLLGISQSVSALSGKWKISQRLDGKGRKRECKWNAEKEHESNVLRRVMNVKVALMQFQILKAVTFPRAFICDEEMLIHQ